MKQKVINVILSGGSGTRLWPLSRTSNPKQFLQIFDSKSLFQHTLERNQKVADEFMLITNEVQYEMAANQAIELGISIAHKIIEPCGRNTAPAIALAALAVHPDDILFVTPSDHMIADPSVYKKCIDRASELAQNNQIVTFGIQPTEPHTGYGYIEFNGEEVLKFREKPSLKDAKLFLEAGNFYWNSGMFCFKASVLLEELKKYNPEMYQKSVDAYKTIQNGKINLEAMQQIPADSIDYAVLEKSDLIKTIASKFYWTDLGSFDAIVNYFDEGNTVDNLNKISSEKGSSYVFGKKKVVGAEVANVIVVDTEDAILVLPKNESDLVKGIYNKVKESNKELT
ncbi:sugar phosphate nucleotidyltransferase [Lutibacter sp. TH_r2]|uniref:mannose-1-phosphate guanylyltransferase n=1 Tax=Lutibacter sp. TH_r2 TaxID=3082083 RepID=UPI002952CB72|nr:sugar phosphate nucleotidyltransferase [Lutibacter sp. TH_r2]MDV7187804.1 sugar phosphate nucleotidyltransferase [Lutibacter sp. TH_r2]